MISLHIKRLLGQFWRIKRTRKPRRMVLLYHAVGEGPNACPESLFAKHMAWLAAETKVLPLEFLLDGTDAAPLQVAITFDDGYASVAQRAAPIMARHGLTATVYLTAGQIADENEGRLASCPELGHFAGEEFMLWSEVKALHATGWQIGSHGLDHLDMTELPSDELNQQLQRSRVVIEERIGSPCNAFAYPWGRNSEHVQNAVAKAGYAHAAGAIHGIMNEKVSRLAFPRIDMRRDYTLEDVRHIVHGNWDYLGMIQALRTHRLIRK